MEALFFFFLQDRFWHIRLSKVDKTAHKSKAGIHSPRKAEMISAEVAKAGQVGGRGCCSTLGTAQTEWVLPAATNACHICMVLARKTATGSPFEEG